MPKFFVKNDQIKENKIQIIGQDVEHIKKVLRLDIDDNIKICNIDTNQNYICGISKINEASIECTIFKEIQETSESNVHINVFQGLPKFDKMELIIQKSVELGANEITPVAMKRCVVKLNEKDKAKKIERWQKISESAAKQSGRDTIPKINNVININKICELLPQYDAVLVAYENEKENALKNELQKLKIKFNESKQYESKQDTSRLSDEKLNDLNCKIENKKIKIGIVIGPEGGLESKDVETLQQNGCKIITLGKRILRTETVALNMISIIMYELES